VPSEAELFAKTNLTRAERVLRAKNAVNPLEE
jgi:hypothetical protein